MLDFTIERMGGYFGIKDNRTNLYFSHYDKIGECVWSVNGCYPLGTEVLALTTAELIKNPIPESVLQNCFCDCEIEIEGEKVDIEIEYIPADDGRDARIISVDCNEIDISYIPIDWIKILNDNL